MFAFPRQFWRLTALACAGSLLCSCSSSSKDEAKDPVDDSGNFVFETGSYTVESAAESYQCFTQTLTEDLSVDRIWYDGKTSVHHLVMVQTLAPEPDGTFECDTFFKPTWIPLFANGTGSTTLDLPAGSSFFLPKGTQLLVQLHLLNATNEPVTDSVKIRARPVEPTANLAGIYGFGTTLIDLPPSSKSSVTNDCTVDSNVDIFAVFPHMHTKGTSLTFSVGKDKESLEEVYRVEPWDFDKQEIEPFPLVLEPGTVTRTTCSYDNTTSDKIVFGESTFNEMCFFTAFRTNFENLAGCLELGGWAGLTPDGGAGADAGGGY
jgi:hypothetical protein